MRRILFACLLTLACLFVVFGVTSSSRKSLGGEPTGREREIDEWITQLGSDRFEVREAAMRHLRARSDAIAALRRARKSDDAEVARRAGDLLDFFERKDKERAFARLADLAKSGAVDQVAEILVRREKWDDQAACWQVIADLAGRLTDIERRTYGTASLRTSPPIEGADEFRRVVLSSGLRLAGARRTEPELWKGRMVLRAEDIARAYNVSRGSFIVLSGSVEVGTLKKAVILAGGSVKVADFTFDSLIVCDGDFTSGTSLANSLVIARGTISCFGSVGNSRLISCADVKFKRAQDVVNTKVVEKEAKPLGFITFFDPADVGVKVEKADGGARVKEAAQGRRFAAAGVRADDLITAIDGDAVKDSESFRRLLRARLAVDADMVLKVRRGEQAIQVRVPGKE